MINEVKIDFQLIGKSDLESLLTGLKPAHNPYKKLISTISLLNKHSEKIHIAIQVSNNCYPDGNSALFGQLHDFIQSLTKREMEIYTLALKGCCNKVIAEKLFITIETVKSHRKNIVKKARVKKIEEIKNLILEANKLNG